MRDRETPRELSRVELGTALNVRGPQPSHEQQVVAGFDVDVWKSQAGLRYAGRSRFDFDRE